MQVQPYFMTNERWYYVDELTMMLRLTDEGKAIEAVVQSYDEFYATHYDEDGNVVDH